MKHRFKILVTLILLFSFNSKAQELFVAKDEAIENLIAYLSENDEQEIDFEELTARLSLLYDNPLNLNTCNEEDLSNLSLFSSLQIMNIIEYRKKYNGLVSLYELKLIEGIGKEQIILSVPFLKISEIEKYIPPINLKNLQKMSKHSMVLRYQRAIETQAAYKPDENGDVKYLGSPDRIYYKYKFQFTNKIRAGITADKDAGEPFFTKPNSQGFDFYSAFLQIQNQGVIKNLVVGDYSLQFGQGLALWNGYRMGKSTMVTNVSKFGKGVDKYSSTDENNFFRGAATTLSYNKMELSIFFSSKKIDASVSNDTLNNEIDRFTAFDATGIHVTANDFEQKDAINQMVYGADFSYKLDRLKVGATFFKYQFSHSLDASSKPYKKYDFSGSEGQNASFHYQWNMNQIYFSGEVATDYNFNYSVINSAIFNISSKVGLAILYRYFDEKYQALYASAFSEGTKAQNEQGFYAGIHFYPTKNWIVKAYVDLYEFPWLRYQISKPSSGIDYFVVAEYALSSNFNFYLKFKSESKLKDFTSDYENTIQQKETNKKQFRAHFNYGDRSQFHFKTRLEYSFFEHLDKQQGMLAYQDIVYDWRKFPVKTTLRFLVFDTDGYDSRIYTYENDLLYNYAIPAFSDRGIRSYLLLKYDLSKNLTFWIKYGLTIYSNQTSLGSGNTEIDGNRKSEIKLQVRWKF